MKKPVTDRSSRPLAEDLHLDPARLPVLIVEDHPETRLIYEKFLRNSRYQPILSAGPSRSP